MSPTGEVSRLTDQTEDEILALASQGDREAFGQRYAVYGERIFNYVYYRTGNVHDAEDLTEKVFFRALNHIHNYKNRGYPFTAWLYRIAHNLVANWHRDNHRKKEISLDDLAYSLSKGDHPENKISDAQELEGLMHAIYRMSSDRQNLIILKFIEGLSNAEIAAILGRSEGAVKSLYHRTLSALREDVNLDFGD